MEIKVMQEYYLNKIVPKDGPAIYRSEIVVLVDGEIVKIKDDITTGSLLNGVDAEDLIKSLRRYLRASIMASIENKLFISEELK